ncbi:MAG: hypothetical protein J6F30_17170 [Cellulosilyticum sp.]|nr:hypothetical protein [Cellulosilyticum sp.]
MGKLIDVDRLKEVFSRNVVGGNAYFDLIDAQPTVQAISKADYENRLKSDMVAMLEEISLEIDEMDCTIDHDFEGYYTGHVDCQKLIREKINSLKENTK